MAVQKRRPHPLDEPAFERNTAPAGAPPDVRPVTFFDAIIERVRAGAPVDFAARSVGISPAQLRDWAYDGARARHKLMRELPLTYDEQRSAEFSVAIERAEAEALIADWSRLGLLAQGGIRQETTTTKLDGQGTVIEATTRVEHTLPDRAALMFRLERRWPELFSPRVNVDETLRLPGVAAVEDVEQRAARLVDEITRFRQGQVIDALSSDASGSSTEGDAGAEG